jgi:hypothetical protein
MNISTTEGEFITSCENKTKWEGRVIETWYEESRSSAYAWGAFIVGVGTSYGASREEAIENVKVKAKGEVK